LGKNKFEKILNFILIMKNIGTFLKNQLLWM
jgi:hypothetical protein